MNVLPSFTNRRQRSLHKSTKVERQKLLRYFYFNPNNKYIYIVNEIKNKNN